MDNDHVFHNQIYSLINAFLLVCKAIVDLGFLIDGSTSIGSQENFSKELDFVINIVDGFEVSQKGTHVGAVVFNQTQRLINAFNQSYNKQYIIDRIKSTQWPTGYTRIGEAIRFAKRQLYKQSSRVKRVPKILIILTDGVSQDKIVSDAAEDLRKFGVTIFAVGIGREVDIKELNCMASDPDSRHVFKVLDLSKLGTILKAIHEKACQSEPFSINICFPESGDSDIFYLFHSISASGPSSTSAPTTPISINTHPTTQPGTERNVVCLILH